MSYLLSGSFAYDTILLHEGHFHARILPESLARLNVAFGIDESKKEFGGCGGNIAYNASLLKDKVVVCSSVGNDFYEYEEHFKKNGLSAKTLTKHEGKPTAHAWVMTDKSNNQITGFQMGALKLTPTLPQNALHMDLWHLAPDSARTTAFLAKHAIENNINYFLDPGQCLPSFIEGDAEDVCSFKKMLENAKGLFVNEYESQLLQEKFGKDLSEFLNENNLFIIETLGSKGLTIYTHNEKVHVPVAKPVRVLDPTGCGDSLRAGFLYGFTRSLTLQQCAELGSIMASFVIENYGGQNHKPTKEEISQRLKNTFGWVLV